jgi:hypothetical protein
MKRIIKMKGETLTNQKETDRAIKAAVDQAKKVRTHCAVCGCTPKPDEWSIVAENCCFDCA